MEILVNDIRYGIRSLLKHKGFTAVAVITLALGIGANTAIFTVIDAVMLRALPVKDPQQLVFLSNPDRHGVNGGQETGDRNLFSYHEFEWLRDHNEVFSEVFAVQSALSTQPVLVEGADQNGEAERTRISAVSGGYFSGLGVNTILGRPFTAEIDKASGANPVAVISYDYWKNRFAVDRAIVGRRIRVRQTSFEVIGVAQPGFSGETVGSAPDLWVPLTMETEVSKEVLAPPNNVRNKYMWLQVMARLKPGVTLEQANASVNLTLQQMLQSETSQLSTDERAGHLNQRIALTRGSRGASTLRTSFGEPLLILMGLVALVLLIACANVANLFLARAATRQKEIAVRVALGAGRGRLTQQLLTESLLLAMLAGVLGLLLAQWADALLVRLASTGSNPIPLDLHLDARILGFTIAVSLLTGVLFGLAPAMRASRVDLNALLKEGAKGTTGSSSQAGRLPAAKILVVGQVALSFVLLIVMGLFLRSFQKLTQTRMGYDSEHLLQFSIAPPKGYQGAAVNQLHKRLLERIRAIPGVRSASLSLSGLFSGTDLGMNISINGSTPAPGQQISAFNDYVGPNYFSTADIPIFLGREIGPEDEGNAPLVGVINQTMARTYFGDANPIGRQIKASAPFGNLAFTVVGIVADSKHDDLRTPSGSWFYTPYFHVSRHPNFSWATNEVRISGNTAAVATAIRAAAKDTSPLIEMPEIHTINELVGQTITTERLITTLSSFFGMLALLLACIGLYGAMSYNVVGRTNEIGIRMALGAQPRNIFRLIARQGMTLVLIGIVVGLSAALALTRLISSLLYGVSATDSTTFVIVAVLLAAVALLACYLPARRATKVDPLVALRYE
ncbi:MAG TPA: ABC transporter permease [Pyrinomonadaceae bacterium]|nr:ABC transporter permease [Pyrinomonadaceae bacterium]